MSVWIFGYGSLIWRPDFDYLERRRARLAGWQRRFWQGSHDHRGVPRRPGRVVTLVEEPGAHCDGMAYRVDQTVLARTFEALDHREKNGYQRREVRLEFVDDGADRGVCLAHPGTPERAPAHGNPGVVGVVYIATTDNHAFLGPAPLPDMARQIVSSAGPSGRNLDYLLALAQALRDMGAVDSHVFELAAVATRLHLERNTS